MTKTSNVESEKQRKLTFSDDNFDVEKYNNVALHAQLGDIRLLVSTFALKPECISEFDDPNSNHDHRFEGHSERFSYDVENGIAIGTIAWIAEVKSGRKKALKLTAEYLTVYGGLGNMDLDYVGLYFGKVAKFATYPYFRNLFSVQTSAAGLQLPPLPSLIDRVD